MSLARIAGLWLVHVEVHDQSKALQATELWFNLPALVQNETAAHDGLV